MSWRLKPPVSRLLHYNDVTMSKIASQITNLTIVYSICLFRPGSNKTSKLRVTGLCAGNSSGTGEFPAQMASNAKNVSIWWRHHGGLVCQKQASRAGISDNIPHIVWDVIYVWDVITCPCPRYLLLVHKATIEEPFSLSTFPLAGWQRLNQLRRSVDNRAWAPNPLSSGIVVIDTKARLTKATTNNIVHYSVQCSPSIRIASVLYAGN